MIPAQGYVCVWRADSLSGRHSLDDLCRLRDCNTTLAALPGLCAADLLVLQRHAASIECRVRWRLFVDAIKSGRLVRAAGCFRGPWPLPAHLLRMLGARVASRLAAVWRWP